MSGRILVVIASVIAGCGSSMLGTGHEGSGGEGGTTVNPGTGGGAGGTGSAAVSPFFPTMFVTIDGVRKSYRLSDLRQRDMLEIEFSTGHRQLGAEAVAGEFYSEVWLRVTTDGQTPVVGQYDCLSAGSSALPGQRALQTIWSFNHGFGPAWTNFSTLESGGPCTATFQDLGTTPGDRIRGSFAATLDGGHVLSEGTFDLVVPRTLVEP